MKPKTTQRASLRVSLAAFSPVDVDEQGGIIRNASVMSVGPAAGHGFEIDRQSLEQLVAAIQRRGGSVKVRIKHPEVDHETGQEDDDVLSVIGAVSNVRLEGDCVRGDVRIEDYAASLPGYGDVRAYILKRAASDPEWLGLSAVIVFDPEPVNVDGVQHLVARISECEAVDIVGTPAANPNGLLSAKAPRVQHLSEKESTMDEIEIKDLIPLLIEEGLTEGASEEEAKEYFEGLPEEKQTELKAKLQSEDTIQASEGEDTVQASEGEDKLRKGGKLSKRNTNDNGDTFLAMEGKRVSQVTALGNMLRVKADVVQLAIAKGDDVIAARKRFLEHLQKVAKPVDTQANGASISVGEDRKRAMFRVAMVDAIRLRAGSNVKDPHPEAVKLRGITVLEQFRRYLMAHGVKAEYMSVNELADLFTSPRRRAALAQSTSDFDNILLDASNKTLRQAYNEIPSSWNLWARRSTNPDFKPGNRIQLSEIGLPIERKEGGEIRYNTLSDGKEQVTLTEYTTGIRLTRRAIINDDLDALSRIPTQLGQAFRRLEDRLAYGVLTTNANLSDGGALFNSTALTTSGGHANIASGTGVAGSPTVTTLAATSALMRKQVGMKKLTGDQSHAYLDLRPKALIVPVALEVVAAQLVGSSVDPSKSNATPNPYFNSLTVVSHPILDVTSTSQWYLSADPNVIDTAEVCFLQDEPEPVIKNETEFDTDDIKFAGRHTITAKAIDYRGLVRNGA